MLNEKYFKKDFEDLEKFVDKQRSLQAECLANGWSLEDGEEDGEYFVICREVEKPSAEELLAEAKKDKLTELKAARDAAELLPVNNFDVDQKSLMRISAAITALEAQGDGASINWTLADNTTQEVTAADLQAVICALAVQSNAVHEKYRVLKEQVEKAESNEAVEEIVW